MYDRKKYKKFALKQLKGRWGVPVLMTFLVFLITSLFDIPDYITLFSNPDFWGLLNYTGSDPEEVLSLYSSTLQASSGSTITTLVQVIVAGIFEVATISVYLKMTRSPEKISIGAFFEGLTHWARATLATLWQFLWVFLWSLLFVIPGIIKAFAYSQMYYLICEYKELSVTKAMRISIIITRGHKWDLFVTYLSFIGWGLLCCITLGIGFLWLSPYMNTTLTNAYHAMLKEAIDTGKIKPEDLVE